MILCFLCIPGVVPEDAAQCFAMAQKKGGKRIEDHWV